jgi:hypothetical protein
MRSVEGQPSLPPDADFLPRLLALGDDLVEALAGRELVPKFLVAWVWWIFAELIRVADEADDGTAAREAAWLWHAKLDNAFGPFSLTG